MGSNSYPVIFRATQSSAVYKDFRISAFSPDTRNKNFLNSIFLVSCDLAVFYLLCYIACTGPKRDGVFFFFLDTSVVVDEGP